MRTMAKRFFTVFLSFLVILSFATPLVSHAAVTTLLLSNSVIATDEEVTVTVSAEEEGEYVLWYTNSILSLVDSNANYTLSGNAITFYGSEITFTFQGISEGTANLILDVDGETDSSAQVTVGATSSDETTEDATEDATEDDASAEEETEDATAEDEVLADDEEELLGSSNASATEISDLKDQVSNQRYLIAALLFVILILLIVIINLIVSKRRLLDEIGGDPFADEDEGSDEDEMDDEGSDEDEMDDEGLDDEVDTAATAPEEGRANDDVRTGGKDAVATSQEVEAAHNDVRSGGKDTVATSREEEAVNDDMTAEEDIVLPKNSNADEDKKEDTTISYKDVKGTQAFKSSSEIHHKTSSDEQIDIIDLNDL